MRATKEGRKSQSIGTQFEEWMSSDWEFGPYYWQTGEKTPVWRKGLQVSLWTGERMLRGSEFVGEVIANIFGLNESDYQWVVDAAAEEEEKNKERLRKENYQYSSKDTSCSRNSNVTIKEDSSRIANAV